MKIGHICLANQESDDPERFVALVAALAKFGIEQHVLVGSAGAAESLAGLAQVTVGPPVRTPVTACCLMPEVDLAHIHEVKSGQAGLLLTLTRSIPYVISVESEVLGSRNPLTRSVLHRAVQLVAKTPAESTSKTAAEYLRIYRDVLGERQRPALMR